jgi:hypothetical protein
MIALSPLSRALRTMSASAVALLFATSVESASAVGQAQPSATDATSKRLAEDDFLRGVGDLALLRALDDLDRTEPVRDPQSTEALLRVIARDRATLRSDACSLPERLKALDRLRATRSALVAREASDPFTVLWIGDAAEDELTLAFFGADGGADAIAGSFGSSLVPRARAALERVLALLESADSRAASIPPDRVPAATALAQRLDSDARARRPFLRAAVRAFLLAMERTAESAAASRERPAKGAELLRELTALRPQLPPRLRPESDLAEVAAAAVAAQCDAARYAAARIISARDPTLTVLARILSCDCLVNERRGEEAVRQLVALHAVQGLTTPLRLLVADAIVRTRGMLGKSSTTELTLRPWIDTLDKAQASERAGVRRAVLERIAGAARGQPAYGDLPPLAEVAIARDALLANPADGAALARLAPHATQSRNATAQVAALETIADAVVTARMWPEASDAYRALALAASQEPISISAMQAALDIELALDRADPAGREAQLEETLGLAINRFPELPSRPASLAQLEAIQTRRLLQQALSAGPEERASLARQAADAAQRVADLDAAARRAGLDPGGRVAATAEMARTAADFLAPSAAQATRATALPSREQWESWTKFDAQRILRLRLERAAMHAAEPARIMTAELALLPDSMMDPQTPAALTAITNFMRRQVELAGAANLQGSPLSVQFARRALAAGQAWESLTATRGGTGSPQVLAGAFDRLAADAALLAQEWENAIARAEAIALANPSAIDDQRRLVEALAWAHKDAVRQGLKDLRDERRTRGMSAARALEAIAPDGSPAWWLAQSVQLRIAEESGRGGEPVLASIARLRAADSTLGGPLISAEILETERAAIASSARIKPDDSGVAAPTKSESTPSPAAALPVTR